VCPEDRQGIRVAAQRWLHQWTPFIEAQLNENEVAPDKPVRTAPTREEMIQRAKVFVTAELGPVGDAVHPDRWYENFGRLCAFILDNFPEGVR
jgi:hypothetical protein